MEGSFDPQKGSGPQVDNFCLARHRKKERILNDGTEIGPLKASINDYVNPLKKS